MEINFLYSELFTQTSGQESLDSGNNELGFNWHLHKSFHSLSPPRRK